MFCLFKDFLFVAPGRISKKNPDVCNRIIRSGVLGVFAARDREALSANRLA